MGELSAIEWTDHTFNPWIGCERISPACDHCYAEKGARRLGAQHGLKLWEGDRFFTGVDYWRQPRRWDAVAAAEGRRDRVFCASYADVFEDRVDLLPRRRDLLRLILETPNLDWLLLTKRPENMLRLTREEWGDVWPVNAWAGATVEDQERADARIPFLRAVPSTVRFLSCEPLLGPVDLTPHLWPTCWVWDGHYQTPADAIAAGAWAERQRQRLVAAASSFVNWVIVGGESGPGARAFDLGHARRIIADCKASGTKCFVKQLGAHVVHPTVPLLEIDRATLRAVARAERPKVLPLVHRKGGDPAEWPRDLRVREFPNS